MPIPNLADVPTAEKFAMIDELWDSIRRNETVEMHPDHLPELDKRAEAVRKNPGIALSPIQAKALLKK